MAIGLIRTTCGLSVRRWEQRGDKAAAVGSHGDGLAEAAAVRGRVEASAYRQVSGLRHSNRVTVSRAP